MISDVGTDDSVALNRILLSWTPVFTSYGGTKEPSLGKKSRKPTVHLAVLEVRNYFRRLDRALSGGRIQDLHGWTVEQAQAVLVADSGRDAVQQEAQAVHALDRVRKGAFGLPESVDLDAAPKVVGENARLLPRTVTARGRLV